VSGFRRQLAEMIVGWPRSCIPAQYGSGPATAAIGERKERSLHTPNLIRSINKNMANTLSHLIYLDPGYEASRHELVQVPTKKRAMDKR